MLDFRIWCRLEIESLQRQSSKNEVFWVGLNPISLDNSYLESGTVEHRDGHAQWKDNVQRQ